VGYNDYTAMSANVVAGSSYSINFSFGYWRGLDVEYFKIWIDFNHDGIFDDISELVVNGTAVTSDIYTSIVNVPASAYIGQTRMRVSMSDDPNFTACSTFASGEVEDYSVTISGTAFSGFASTQSEGMELNNDALTETVSVFPNPASDYIHVSYAAEGIHTIKIYNLQGALIRELNSDETIQTIDISNFKAGMYQILISGNSITKSARIIKK
jgi:hypothetical protein